MWNPDGLLEFSHLSCCHVRFTPVEPPSILPSLVSMAIRSPLARSTTIHFVSTPAEPEVVTARNRLTGRQAVESLACLPGLVRASEMEKAENM